MFSARVCKILFQVPKRSYITATKIGVLGVPFEHGQRKGGVSDAPDVVRNAGLIKQIGEIHEKIDVKDYGNISYTIDEKVIVKDIPNMREYAHVAFCNREVSRNVKKIINEGRVCVTLGGDHSVAVGSVDGHVQTTKDICLLWVDAHADLHTNETSESGNVHGMPLALLVKELSDYWPYLPGMDWQKPEISIRNCAYIGLRSVDSYERLIIEKLGITTFGIEDVEQYGIAAVVNMALGKVDPERRRSIHVSYDIDALDTLEAPSTGTAVRGGLTLREGIHIMEALYNTGRLGAMDLVEINPSIGSPSDVKKTVDAAIHLILAGCGYQRRGLRPYNVDTLPPASAIK